MIQFFYFCDVSEDIVKFFLFLWHKELLDVIMQPN